MLRTIVTIAVLAGCAQSPDYPEYYDAPRAKADQECRYEAMKASPASPSSMAGLGVAIGAAAAREAEIYAMCMRMRGFTPGQAAPPRAARPPVICKEADDGIVDCWEAK